MFPKYIIIPFLLIFLAQNKVDSQTYNAEVLNYRSIREVENDNLIEVDSVTIQINNREGNKYAEIEVEYSKNEELWYVDAWIETMSGTKVRHLKKSNIVDKSAISAISMYEDHFKKCFELKYNEYPYKVTYTFKKQLTNFLYIANWSPVLDISIPTRKASLNVVFPKNFKVNTYKQYVLKTFKDSIHENTSLKFTALYNKPFTDEIYSQPENFIPTVIVAPVNFFYGVKGCLKDWQSFGNWQYKLLEGLDLLPEKEKKVISSLTKGITDKKEIVRVLYHYMQDNTRYINVTLGIGGLKPYPASYVAQNKYGDCKALTNYMKAILAYAGVESFYTLVFAGDQPHDLIKNFAEQQFNHAILAVPVDKDTIWLENTSNINPFGYMGSFTQNRPALLISNDNSKLVRIPALKKEDNLITSNYIFDLELNGNTKAVATFCIKGNGFDIFNYLNSTYNDNIKDRYIREYLLEDCELTDWRIKKFDRDSARIDLNTHQIYLKMLNQLGTEYYFSIHSMSVPAFTNPANRTLPVSLPYPIYKRDTLIYNLPNGFEIKNNPNPVRIESEFGNYKQKVDALEGKIIVIKSFELSAGNYNNEQYQDFYKFIKSVKEFDSRKLIIKPKL